MRFLLDANLSPRLVNGLASAGYETRHVGDVGLLAAADDVIFEWAARAGDVLITADSDFSLLLAARGTSGPSVVLLRQVAELAWSVHLSLIVRNLPSVIDDLEVGAIVSLSPSRLAVRRLPIVRDDY